jgi:undecaprenyl-phosphate 4-deoxy-4-formamido-L-arabinose transferase
VSVVIPVYRGSTTLPGVLGEILPLTQPTSTTGGRTFRVTEVVLVDDRGEEASAETIRKLAAAHEVVHPVWLSRNYGQHAATLAGVAATGSEWVVTLDEDGQHDPARIGDLLDTAMTEQADVVYAKPTNQPPHGFARNLASRAAKALVHRLGGGAPTQTFHSYRFMLGEVARSVAAYAGPGIYLDIAIHWVAGQTAQCPMAMREESGRASGYNAHALLSHFWRLVLSSGTKPLRWVSFAGVGFSVAALLVSVVLILGRLVDQWVYPGWTSTLVVILFCTGVILFCLGVIAEYVGVAVGMAMGKPLYLPVRDRAEGPLGRER